jgi:tRNA (guanine37-N1)-methyltransferase
LIGTKSIEGVLVESVLKVGLITLFPGMFSALTEYGVTGRAIRNGVVKLQYWNPRDFTTDKHRTVDDRPYGGGPGMLMKTGPLTAAINAAKAELSKTASTKVGIKDDIKDSNDSERLLPKVLYLSPQGKPLDQAKVNSLAQAPSLVLLCGRYEGVDERVLSTLVDEECSLGDFVLSGGELAAMALLDAVIRRVPGVLGAAESVTADSFEAGLLDHPHYTRPEVFADVAVPPVLLSGDHAAIAKWRAKESLRATWRKRPDLIERLQASGSLNAEQLRWLAELRSEQNLN